MSDRELIQIESKSMPGTPRYWRSLEEAADPEGFAVSNAGEIPLEAGREAPEGIDRRTLLSGMAASLGLAGLTACESLPQRDIVPYVQQPEAMIPGKPQFYATAMQRGDRVVGLLAESHLGRPTKLEGNPSHPLSLGATDIFAQAEVLTLWDPHRSSTVRRGKEIADWGTFAEECARIRERLGSSAGKGMRLLTGTVLSPSLRQQIQQLLTAYPEARWHSFEAGHSNNADEAARLMHGQNTRPLYRIENAEVIVSLDADFLNAMPGSLAYARAFARWRKPGRAEAKMNRLYVAEPMPSPTGSSADHRLRARASEIETLAAALKNGLGLVAGAAPQGDLSVEKREWIRMATEDLLAHRGRALMIPGDFQSVAVHRIAHEVNAALGAEGSTMEWIAPEDEVSRKQGDSLRDLVRDMENGAVQTLLILDANPAYSAPESDAFVHALQRVPLRMHAGLYENETSLQCHWHLPLAHFLESWGDLRGFEGSCTIVQPLIYPLKGQRSAHEILATLMGLPVRTGRELVESYWKEQIAGDGAGSGEDFALYWRRCLHDGVFRDGSSGGVAGGVAGGAAGDTGSRMVASGGAVRSAEPIAADGWEVLFRPDPTVFDGRYSNNGWLQELPKPISSLTWGNAAYVSPMSAEELGVENEDVVELALGEKRIEIPVWIVPGQADGCVTLHLGGGRRETGGPGDGVGVDVNPLRTWETEWSATGAVIRKLGRRIPLAARQRHQNMEGRDLIRTTTLRSFAKEGERGSGDAHSPVGDRSLYPTYDYTQSPQWGMSIDLSACIGCGACTIACQAENNIPVVGKEEVARGRSMHWIRLDTYFDGDPAAPGIHHQPVPCMQCENAPCEVVCPVAATVHNGEGLNQMVYNRCVGTRYCSNNCPYKVRRFNFFQYADYETEELKGQRNPDVTVRSLGVMEKCTYCVQRIEEAKIRAKVDDVPLRDGDVVSACQQVCPTEAIVFGDILDPTSKVFQQKAELRNYTLLPELNTRPRTSYLARVVNPHEGSSREPDRREEGQ